MVLKSEDNEIKYLCEIEAEPIYLEAHSSPEADKYVFAYTIRILIQGAPCEVNESVLADYRCEWRCSGGCR